MFVNESKNVSFFWHPTNVGFTEEALEAETAVWPIPFLINMLTTFK